MKARLLAAKALQSLEVASELFQVPSSQHQVTAKVVALLKLSEGRKAETKADWLMTSAGVQLLAVRLALQFL